MTLLNVNNGTTIVVADTALNVTGQMTGGTITAIYSNLDIAGQMTGGTIMLNASTLMIGEGVGSTPSATNGSIVYGAGVDSVVLANITSGANAVTLKNLYNNDSFAESNIPFDSVTLSGNVMMLQQGGTTVATFNVTLANGASTTFEPVTTKVIDGKTYYVATLDPPAPAAAAASDPLTAPISQDSVLGSSDTSHGKFLHDTGTAAHGHATVPQAAGAPADLMPPDVGTQLTADLTNIGNVANDPSQQGSDAAGSGHDSTPHIDGIGAVGGLDTKPDVNDPLTHQQTTDQHY